LQARSSWTTSPVEIFSQNTTSQLVEERNFSQYEVDAMEQGCLGCSSWPKTFAFVIALVIICAAAVLIPVVLTNTLGLVTKLTTTTGKSMDNNFFNYFMNINVIL
jgi:hypothetical protein